MKEITMETKPNLDSRSAALFVQTASQFTSNIQIKMDDKATNAKSIMGVISLSILAGTVVTISAEGTDEEEAVQALTDLLNS